MTRQLAPLLLLLCGFFMVSCCFLHVLLNQLDDYSSINPTRLHQAIFRDSPRGFMPKQGFGRRPARKPRESLRAKYDVKLDPSIIESSVQALRIPELPTMDPSLPYDINRCPDQIPAGYPMQWNAIDVLKNWNPDNTTIPSNIYQGLCSLDWKDPVQRDLAETYRKAEVPFVIHNHPEVWRTAERWSHYEYLLGLLGGDNYVYRNEHALGNHMPYWKLRGPDKKPPGWTPPTENVELSFPKWYEKAMQLERPQSFKNITQAEHWYFRLNGAFQSENKFLYDELPIFTPTDPSFFMPEPQGQRGINCRFGSKGIIAETHYDFSRNFILILQGQKRYVLAHPNQCQNLELHPMGHPSARHSKVDWSNPDEWQTGRFPQAQVNEIILQAGDTLYLPTAWFHFIVSLSLNYQCNARSGITYESYDTLKSCGFA